MKRSLILIIAKLVFVGSVVYATLSMSLPFVAVKSVPNEEPVNDVEKENVILLADRLSNILTKLDVKFNPEKDFNNTVFNHAYYSTDFNRCVETMHEPALHDGLSKEDVRKLLGNPEYEAEDVWIYPSGWYLLVFKDGKLNKLALLDVGEHSVDIARIDNALNIDEVRKEIQKRIQEEKEFKVKRDAILNSDEELSKLAAMPSKEMWELLGDDDTEKTGFSGWCPYVVYMTDKRHVLFGSKDGIIKYIARYDLENGEQKTIYLDTEDSDYLLTKFSQHFENLRAAAGQTGK